MSREEFLKRIANMDPEEHERTTAVAEAKNPELTRRIETGRKVRKLMNVAKTLGIGEAFYSSGSYSHTSTRETPTTHGNHGTSHNNSDYRPRGFSIYDVNQVEVASAKAYFKGADGKGDHDCDHEH